jgi:hypothetical protein
MTTTYDANIPYDSSINYDGGTPVVTSTQLPSMVLSVTNKLGVTGPLPHARVETIGFEDSGPSAIGFSLPGGSLNANLCDYYSIVSLSMNGKPIRDGQFLLRNPSWNAGDQGGAKSWTGKSLLWDRLVNTTIQPGRSYKYQRKSPGHIFNDIFTEAKNRDVGYWENFTWTFTDSADTAGHAWPTVIDIEYLVTAKYSDIVANLVDKGLVEIHLNNNEIQVYVAETSGTVTDALLVLGKDLGTAPQQGSAENIVSDVTVLGDDGVAVTRSNPDTRAAYWREEAGISQGGTKDETTLALFGDVALSGGGVPKVQRQYELVITHERPFLPLRDYNVGDWVSTQHSDESRLTLRVKQITLKQDGKKWTGSLVLNDKFEESEIRLAKKVNGIIGGATITGSSQSSTPDDVKDTGIPAPMTGLTLDSDVIELDDGRTRAYVTVNWDEVTHNTDGTVATDMGTYFLNWWYGDMPATSRVEIPIAHPQTNWVLGDLDPGREIVVYVYSKDNNGHQGSWTGIEEIVASADTIAPSQPSNPLTTSILRTVIVEYDGLAESGAAMEPDTDFVEVWSSIVNNFNPDTEGDFHGRIYGGPGQFYIPAYAYTIGTTIYLKFVAVDKSGNRSVPSIQNAQVVQGVSGFDLTANSVTTNQLAAGAVTAQKIAVGAINVDTINIGQTVNLVPDPSFNSASWRARRLTTEWNTRPAYWFFNNWEGRSRNGYYLQALSTPAGENGGRMYICDWIPVMLGESYYAAMYMMMGEFIPNAEATMTLGVEVTNADGSIESDGINYAPFGSWTKYGYRFTIGNANWVKLRFFVRANDLNSGDIIMDDWEVRGAVGTTANTGSRGLLDPLGLFSWDADENQTFELDFRTGNFTAKGSLQSGFTGKRTIINPGVTNLPEIRFYPQTGAVYAYINASDNGAFPFIGVNAPDIGPSSNALVLFDTSWVLGEINKATGAPAGPAISGSSGNSGALWLEGVLPNTAWSSRAMLSAWRFNCTATTQTISKPLTPAAGFFAPILTPERQTATAGYTWHVATNGAASYQIISSTISPNPRFTDLMLRVSAA